VRGRYFIEQICKVPARRFASEYRYRNPLVPRTSLFVTISQSGETADTLARCGCEAVRLSVVAFRSATSRELAGAESELVMLTVRVGNRRGIDQGFHDAAGGASMFFIALAKHHGADAERERGLVSRLIELPSSWKGRSSSTGHTQACGALRG